MVQSLQRKIQQCKKWINRFKFDSGIKSYQCEVRGKIRRFSSDTVSRGKLLTTWYKLILQNKCLFDWQDSLNTEK